MRKCKDARCTYSYCAHEIESMDDVYALIPGEVDRLNWLFTGTSGVHGSGTTATELLEHWNDEDYRGEHSEIRYLTVLIYQPRKVMSYYGDVEVSQVDLLWLIENEKKTAQEIQERI